MIELLAPAGNIDSLKAAVENGANAVYLGVQEFNARLKADNFTTENLAEWVEYAHLFGVRVYLVMNTSLKEDELEVAVEVARKAHLSKVDAIIVTDTGFLKILCNTMPDIVLHFSTQTGVHNLEGAQEAEKLGAKRIIVSREITIQDIVNIKKNTALEIEAFTHGALCVSFSGGCLMSSFISGNSGNRGLCLQPCRKYYKSRTKGKNPNEGYLLSTSDLCTLPRIQELIASGITSLKIEGRLRRPEYVAQVVKTYRKILDGGKCEKNDIYDLKKIYNRGDFTDGYYFRSGQKNNTLDLMSAEIQSHRGVFAGRITGIVQDKVKKTTILTVENGGKFNDGDGFKVLRKGVEIGSAVALGKMIAGTANVVTGDELYITSDARQIEGLKNQNKRLPIKINFSATAGECAELTFIQGNISASVASDFIVSAPVSSPTPESEIKEQLQKLNNTYFECADISVNVNGNVFMAKSQINELRRRAADKLKNEIISNYDRQTKE